MVDAKYETIRDTLKYRILAGELKRNARVPSEAELCRMYDVSRISAKRALNELENDGYVKRIPGKGTFVSFSPMIHALDGYYSLTNTILEHGDVPSSKLVSVTRGKVAGAMPFDAIGLKCFLHLTEEDEIFTIICLRYRNDDLLALDTTYLPCRYFEGFNQDMIARDNSLYTVIQRDFHYEDLSAWERYFARTINSQEAAYLGVTPGSPALKVMRITECEGRQLIYNWRVYKGESFHLSYDLGRRSFTPPAPIPGE